MYRSTCISICSTVLANSCVHVDSLPVMDRSTCFLVNCNTTGYYMQYPKFVYKSLPRSKSTWWACEILQTAPDDYIDTSISIPYIYDEILSIVDVLVRNKKQLLAVGLLQLFTTVLIKLWFKTTVWQFYKITCRYWTVRYQAISVIKYIKSLASAPQ